ncbi:hypothetical protein [Prochlorococcus sp. MIT 1341]|uniref:hypothetical protein n=1 Tax=Prochlorococcus sp. MIT 1341 TaxID=3096221 RepID=UPI002A75EB93|nr:hypothetical protein [Prochlorococcus sp. MIT 1341]
MSKIVRGYWAMTWLGLFANISALPIIGVIAFAGPPLQAANISLAFSIAWPAAIVGIVACSGLLAERQWGVILTIIALSMALSASLPYGIVRLIIVNDSQTISGLSLAMALLNLLSLIYWCRPIHRRTRRL